MPNAVRDGTARGRAGLAIAVALAAVGMQPACAEIIKASDMLRGIRMTEAQCAARPQTVWVRVVEHEFCIRYYLSTAGGRGRFPLVFLRGDTFGRLVLSSGTFSGAAEAKDVDTDRFAQIARLISEEARVPAIYLARIGLDGSSGHHRLRRTILELNVTNAALEAIKRRHGFDGFHLIGQSGGATLAGGLLARRSDIGCAVLGSGLLAFSRSPERTGDPTTQFFNVADSAAVIARKPFSRILVVTDPADKRVPQAQQTGFVDALRAAGGRAEQIMVQATDENRHGVVAYARTVANGCLRGLPTEEIDARVQRQVQFLLARKAANAPNPPE
jgi:pimeloyl-ACP methyl ester carboxylesterase